MAAVKNKAESGTYKSQDGGDLWKGVVVVGFIAVGGGGSAGWEGPEIDGLLSILLKIM